MFCDLLFSIDGHLGYESRHFTAIGVVDFTEVPAQLSLFQEDNRVDDRHPQCNGDVQCEVVSNQSISEESNEKLNITGMSNPAI